jgi:hypothetical protein
MSAERNLMWVLSAGLLSAMLVLAPALVPNQLAGLALLLSLFAAVPLLWVAIHFPPLAVCMAAGLSLIPLSLIANGTDTETLISPVVALFVALYALPAFLLSRLHGQAAEYQQRWINNGLPLLILVLTAGLWAWWVPMLEPAIPMIKQQMMTAMHPGEGGITEKDIDTMVNDLVMLLPGLMMGVWGGSLILLGLFTARFSFGQPSIARAAQTVSLLKSVGLPFWLSVFLLVVLGVTYMGDKTAVGLANNLLLVGFFWMMVVGLLACHRLLAEDKTWLWAIYLVLLLAMPLAVLLVPVALFESGLSKLKFNKRH